MRLIFTAPVFDKIVHSGQFLLDFFGVGVRLVYLINGKDYGYTGGAGVVDSFDCLRHDVVVCGYDDYTDIGDLGTASTHGGECLVTGGVEECDVATVRKLDIVRTDVLRDAAGLAGDDVGLANIVEQRGLAVVDMAHDGDNRGTRYEVFLGVCFLVYGIGHFGADIFGLEPEFFGHNIYGFGVKALVDGYHHADIHTRCDDLIDGNVHHYGQIVGGHKFGKL